jgi:hypothetical protein
MLFLSQPSTLAARAGIFLFPAPRFADAPLHLAPLHLQTEELAREVEEAFSGGARGGRAAPSGAPQQEQQQHAGGRSHGHGRQQQGGSGGLGDGVEGLRRRPAAPPPQEEAPLDPSVTLEQQELVVRILKAKVRRVR